MAAGRNGFVYEYKINEILKNNNLQDQAFQSAGCDSNAPDALMRNHKIEVKLDLKVDFGQGSLDYNLEKGMWTLGGSKTPSAEAMRELLTLVGVPDLVNRDWGVRGPPRKYTVPLKNFTPEDVAYDYTNFKDHFIEADPLTDPSAICKYYSSKGTHYIQIGGHGLYYMGQDPANLGCTKFFPHVGIRVRLKRGGSKPIYNYRFATALQVIALEKSTFDLEKQEDLNTIINKLDTITKIPNDSIN